MAECACIYTRMRVYIICIYIKVLVYIIGPNTHTHTHRTWDQIIQRIRELSSEGYRVMLVLSALTQVTNRLEMCIKEAVGGQELVSLQWIEETHRRLAKEVCICIHT